MKLKKGERLVYAGDTALRAPNGKLLPSVPQFVIVSATEMPPNARVADLQKTERPVLVGRVYNEKQSAEERFAALKAGREPPPEKVDGVPLYVVEDAANINKKTGLTQDQEAIHTGIAKEISRVFSLHARKMKKT